MVSGYAFVESAPSDYGKAISSFESSRDLFRQLGDTCEAAIAESWAAQFLPDVGRIDDGEKRLSALISDAQTRNFKLLLPTAHYWLGVSNSFQNRISESSNNFKTALRDAEAANNAFEVDHAAEALALHYAELGEFEPAVSFASRMLSFKSLYRESSSQSKRDLGTLARISWLMERYATSLNMASEELSLARTNSKNLRQLNDAFRDVVYAAASSGDFQTALQYANESLVTASVGAKPENARTIAQVYLMLADVKSQKQEYAAALADYDRALEFYQRLPELSVDLYKIHKGKLVCLQKLDQRENFAPELKLVLALSERYRATIREDDSRQAFFDNEQLVFDLAMESALNAGDSRAAYEYGEASRARSLLEFVESEKSIAELEKDFAAVAHPLTLSEIQQRLPEQVQLVQYSLLSDRLVIWTITRSRFDFIEKQVDAAELEKEIDVYRTAIIHKASAESIKAASRNLYDKLVPPDLAADKQLCLVPDKALHQLAFASLISAHGKYLVQDFALSYAPSASVMVLASENAKRKEQLNDERILSIGNPAYEREEGMNLPDLASAELEARSIAGDYRKSVLLTGGEATKAKFLQSFGSTEVIHFAGHFVANPQSSRNSKLLFAEGSLRSSELSSHKLPRAKLVVLSACETGFEHYNRSEGAIGIARTFLALGAPLVLASQWQVDSEPTKDLMIAFHRYRTRDRMTSVESLRKAQLELMTKEETRAPFYWAAFSLFGGSASY